MSAASVTIREILTAATLRSASLVPETSGYIALAVCDAISGAPIAIRDERVAVTVDGAVVVAGAAGPARRGGTAAAVSQDEAARAVRTLLGSLLAASVGSMPGLAAAAKARGASERGMPELAVELEAALIPTNRAASRRALARLARETLRAKELGKLATASSAPASDPVAVAVTAAPEVAPAANAQPAAVEAAPAGVPPSAPLADSAMIVAATPPVPAASPAASVAAVAAERAEPSASPPPSLSPLPAFALTPPPVLPPPCPPPRRRDPSLAESAPAKARAKDSAEVIGGAAQTPSAPPPAAAAADAGHAESADPAMGAGDAHPESLPAANREAESDRISEETPTPPRWLPGVVIPRAFTIQVLSPPPPATTPDPEQVETVAIDLPTIVRAPVTSEHRVIRITVPALPASEPAAATAHLADDEAPWPVDPTPSEIGVYLPSELARTIVHVTPSLIGAYLPPVAPKAEPRTDSIDPPVVTAAEPTPTELGTAWQFDQEDAIVVDFDIAGDVAVEEAAHAAADYDEDPLARFLATR